ncbi:MAG: hypothetical protein IIW87_04050, partial [Alistipes sp.]|nr:hypothetical protein [Alistipes sp.]
MFNKNPVPNLAWQKTFILALLTMPFAWYFVFQQISIHLQSLFVEQFIIALSDANFYCLACCTSTLIFPLSRQRGNEDIMERKKSYTLLIVGAILLVISILFSVYAHNTSYAQSVEIGNELTEVKNQIAAVEAGGLGNLEALNTQKSQLSVEKLNLERPYSYGLTVLFVAVMLTIKGLFNALIGQTPTQKADVKRLTQAGLLAALCYIGFAF